MAYFVHGLVAKKIEFNDLRLGLFSLGELGSDIGLKIQTTIGDYKQGILHIASKLTLLVEHEGQSHWLATCNYHTVFEMDNAAILTRGASKSALSMLKECCDQNQAHAFGQFCYALEKNGLPLAPS